MPAKRYDWDGWFRLRRFRLLRGEDYDCSQSAIVQQVRNEASRRGLRVAVEEHDDGVFVAVLRPTAVGGRK